MPLPFADSPMPATLSAATRTVLARLVVALAIVASSVACASSSRAVPRPYPSAAAPVSHAPGSPSTPDVVRTALTFAGVPYRNGGIDPDGFDCSGFVQYVMAHHGIVMPRRTVEQFDVGVAIGEHGVMPGDLVFFETVAPGASHVGIAVTPRSFVHAPKSGGVIRVDSMDAPYWRARFVGARRVTIVTRAAY